jgi:hypothetical protein
LTSNSPTGDHRGNPGDHRALDQHPLPRVRHSQLNQHGDASGQDQAKPQGQRHGRRVFAYAIVAAIRPVAGACQKVLEAQLLTRRA